MTSIPITEASVPGTAAPAATPAAPASAGPGAPALPAAGGAGSDAVRRALASVVAGSTLSRDEAELAMSAVMDGEATPAQLSGLLVGLRMRGETVDELVGFARAMRARVVGVDAPADAIDTCGTGGDGQGTFNISTGAALVVAAAGVPVAKHGNRAVTSASGSADVLEALGVAVEQSPADAAVALRETGFAFLFAPEHHPAMRHAGPTRRELGVRTAFNLLGPLCNPGGRAPAGRRVRRTGCRSDGWQPRSRASAPCGRSSSTATGSTSCRSTAAA